MSTRYGPAVSFYSLVMPNGFDEDAGMIATKGWLGGVTILAGDVLYDVDFYDPVRFAQTVADEFEADGIAVPANVVVVAEVTHVQIARAVERLSAAAFASLRPTRRAEEIAKGATIHFDGGGLTP